MSEGKAHRPRRGAAPGLRAGALFLALVGAVAAAGGQDGPILSDPVERLDFDAPESWAMKYFSSASLFTGLGPVSSRRAGEIEFVHGSDGSARLTQPWGHHLRGGTRGTSMAKSY